MLAVFWSAFWFSPVEILSKRDHFNALYFCSKILHEIVKNRPADTAEDQRSNMVLHFDNAGAHITRLTTDYMNRNQLVRTPHPPFSPNLALSDFYLFDKVEMALMERMFNDENKLFQCVMDMLNDISRGELEAVVEERLVRFNAASSKMETM
jgi:histone-lysine N-methyltransferase SETMAR